ncbi:Rv3235 family protein [Kribbella sp. NPDC056345]|uniref:Rv3235 family protein n=1 Tax=Kribbella sp. NPDC056345 TaxID=3345789 RepID=UPI0035DA730F
MSSAYQEISTSTQRQRTRLGVVPAVDGTRPVVPEARAWGGRLAQAVSEVLAGDRPVAQLVRFTDEDVFVELNRRVRLLGLTTTANGRGIRERCALQSVRVCRPNSEVAEVAAHVRHGGRSRAIALRMEIRRNRWVCTALEVG